MSFCQINILTQLFEEQDFKYNVEGRLENVEKTKRFFPIMKKIYRHSFTVYPYVYNYVNNSGRLLLWVSKLSSVGWRKLPTSSNENIEPLKKVF